MGRKGTKNTDSDIAFELLASHCDLLFNRIRDIISNDNLTPDSVQATELLVNIEIFIAMEKANLGQMHPEPSEVAKWSEAFLNYFDDHSSDVWDAKSDWVKKRRMEIQKTFKRLTRICEAYHG